MNRLLREVQRKRTPARAGGGNQGKHGNLFLCLLYVHEQLLCRIKSKVRKSGLNIRIAWKNPQKLRNKLIRSSLTKPRCPGGPRCHTCASGFSGDCTQKNDVYRVNCKSCAQQGKESIYIGETKRPVRLRFNEHVCDALGSAIKVAREAW